MPPKQVLKALRRATAAPKRMTIPAAEVESEDSNPAVVGSRPLSGLTMQGLRKLGPVYLSDARYYGRAVQLAGWFINTRLEEGELYADLKVSGTKDDELLRVLSGTRTRTLQVHLCGEDCGALVTDPLLLHGHSFVEVDLRRSPWLTNLEAAGPTEIPPQVDELAPLRKRQEESMADVKKDRKKVSKKEREERIRKTMKGGQRSLPTRRRLAWRLARRSWEMSSVALGWIQTQWKGRKFWRRPSACERARRKRGRALLRVTAGALHRLPALQMCWWRAHQGSLTMRTSSWRSGEDAQEL